MAIPKRKPANPAVRPTPPKPKAAPAKPKAAAPAKAAGVPLPRRTRMALCQWSTMSLKGTPVQKMDSPVAKFALEKKWIDAKGMVTPQGFKVASIFLANQAK